MKSLKFLKKGTKPAPELPELSQLKNELSRENYKHRYSTVLRSTVFTLVVVAALAVLVATLWLPVLQIYGSSMAPTLQDNDIIFCIKTSDFSSGDIISFYYNNKVLVKRVIGGPGDIIEIAPDGAVSVNGELLSEPYVSELDIGECDIDFPFQVPDGRLFVMGDHRATSVDSRSTTVGCVAQEQIVGKIVLRVWPLNRAGRL